MTESRYATDTLVTGSLPYVVTDAEDVRSTDLNPQIVARFEHRQDAESFRDRKNNTAHQGITEAQIKTLTSLMVEALQHREPIHQALTNDGEIVAFCNHLITDPADSGYVVIQRDGYRHSLSTDKGEALWGKAIDAAPKAPAFEEGDEVLPRDAEDHPTMRGTVEDVEQREDGSYRYTVRFPGSEGVGSETHTVNEREIRGV